MLGLVNYIIRNDSTVERTIMEECQSALRKWIRCCLQNNQGSIAVKKVFGINKPVRMQVDDPSRCGIGTVFIQDGKPVASCICFNVTYTNSAKICNYDMQLCKKCWQLHFLDRGFINTSIGRNKRLKVIINHSSQWWRKQCKMHHHDCKECC